ncbi:hypothetical protein ALC152_20950 [Arcobacter sp. 15-2]|uniref:diguanylate cyclase n=1 Tax=Arcobacter sp. 15-2 TaxID=3374109 RepID=UPI00399CEEC8
MYFKSKKVSFFNFLLLYLFLITTFSSISYTVFIENFKTLENNKNTKEINLVLKNMNKTMKEITKKTNEYSYWDETFNFINTRNDKYIQENFRQHTSTLEELNLDLIIYVNLENEIVFSKKDKKISSSDFIQKVSLISLNSMEFNTLGQIDSKIFYLRKSKILKSDGSGKSNGFIYSVKIIDESFLEQYKEIFSNLKFALSESEQKTNMVDFSFLHNVNINTSIKENNFINQIEFYDIFDNYVFSLEMTNPMLIFEKGKQTIFLYNITVAFLLLIILVVLSRKQEDLFKNNMKLETEVNERTAKLNKYITIVNKYVTTSSTDLEGKITHVSEAFCRISGYSKKELLGRTHNIVKHEDMDPSIYVNLWDTISADKKWIGEIKNKKKNGEAYWVLANIEPIYSSNGKKIGYTSIRQEITDKKRVEKLSITDKLTQLYNRVKIEEIFAIEIAKFHRYNTSFSLILIDIDFFKEVNDTYGHNVGDLFLREMADLLKSSVRIEDVVGRWGGEEFVILSNNYTIEGVLCLAEKIRKNVEAYEFSTIGHKTISIGVSILNKEDTQETMIARADKSLYHAKKTGRNKVCLH